MLPFIVMLLIYMVDEKECAGMNHKSQKCKFKSIDI